MRAVLGLLGNAGGLGLGPREDMPEPIRLVVHRFSVHLDDGGPDCPHGTYNARAHGAYRGRAHDIFSGVDRCGLCFAVLRLVRHAWLLMYLPDLWGSLGRGS